MTASAPPTGTPAAAPGRWPVLQPWLSLAARLGLAVVWLVAGWSKVGDLGHSGRVVHAYQLMPFETAKVVGAVLPFVELALGLLLLIGLAVRVTAGLSAFLLVAFIGGIISAWARGLTIDCGCFGGGGDLAAGEAPTYLLDLLRDLGFLLLAGFLLTWPRGWLALDNWLRDDPQLPAGGEPPVAHPQENR